MSTKKTGTWKLFFISMLGLLIASIGIAISIGLSLIGASWAWSIVAMLLGSALYILLSKDRFTSYPLAVLEQFFPIIRMHRAEEQNRFKFQALVDQMAYTMEFYRLGSRMDEGSIVETSDGSFSFSIKFRDKLVNSLLREKDPTQTVQHCAEQIVEEMKKPLSPQVLALLHEDRHSSSTLMTFQKIKKDDNAILELAAILDESQRLPDHINLGADEDGALPDKETLLERGYLPTAEKGFPYQQSDISFLLKESESFNLREIRASMYRLQRVWEITSGYLAFLVQNQITSEDYDFQVSNLLPGMVTKNQRLPLELQDQGKLSGENQIILSTLLQAGEQAFTRKFGDSLTEEELHSLNLIALGMFFTEKRKDCQNLKSAVCRLASTDKIALKQHLAYLEYREILREETLLDNLNFVSVKYIADHWKDTNHERQEKLGSGYDKEIDAIQSNLADGNWWTRLPMMIGDVLEKISKKLDEGIDVMQQVVSKRPPVGEVLRRIFRGLKLETIERFLEARTMTAYLLTFDVLTGSLAALVDCLSFFKGEKYRSQLEEFGVQFTFDDHGVKREKYIFMDYIKQCRLGIVPMGMDFETFYHEFENDLTIVYEHRSELDLSNSEIKKFEIIIQRFGLPGRDRYGFKFFNRDHQREHALPQIQELFASSLVPKDIIALITYEQPTADGSVTLEPIIDGILALGTIKDFLGEGMVDLSKDQEKDLIDNDQGLKQTLLQKLEFKSLRSLAKFLASDIQNKKSVKNKLSRMIRNLKNFEDAPQTCSRISDNYIETLVDIADIYQ